MDFRVKGSMLHLYEAHIAYHWVDTVNEVVFKRFKCRGGLDGVKEYETSTGIIHLLNSDQRVLVYNAQGNVIAKNW